MFREERQMDSVTLSRRSLLQAIAATMATAALPLGWAEIAQAAHELDVAGQRGAARAREDFLPQRGRSGGRRSHRRADHSDRRLARRARGGRGVSSSTGRSRRSSRSSPATIARSSPRFQAACRERHPAAASFAALTSEQQIAYLKDGRPDAVLHHDAAADAARHVLPARLRRQSRRRRLEAASGSRTRTSSSRRSATTTATIPASSSTR